MDVFCCDALHVLVSDDRRATDAQDYHDTGEVTCISSCLERELNNHIVNTMLHFVFEMEYCGMIIACTDKHLQKIQ